MSGSGWTADGDRYTKSYTLTASQEAAYKQQMTSFVPGNLYMVYNMTTASSTITRCIPLWIDDTTISVAGGVSDQGTDISFSLDIDRSNGGYIWLIIAGTYKDSIKDYTSRFKIIGIS